jgi:transcriptional regulator with XRE-family HTH domain
MKAEWFAGRLRELREARGWTQRQLADAAGVTTAAVKSLEQGRNKPTWDTVVALCRALAARPDAFARPPACRPRPRGRPRKAELARTDGAQPPGRKPKRRRRGDGTANETARRPARSVASANKEVLPLEDGGALERARPSPGAPACGSSARAKPRGRRIP